MLRIKLILLLITLLGFGCKKTIVDEDIKSDQTSKIDAKNSKYLKEAELSKFILDAKSDHYNNDNYLTPFDTLEFDKVIAYDFDGGGMYSGILNPQTKRFFPVTVKQKQLTKQQVDTLINFMTDVNTYGNSWLACFEPHLSFMFFKGNHRKLVIDVCLDCNFLQSSSKIPAKIHHKRQDGISKIGFSDIGRSAIIEISKQLDFRYGKLSLKDLRFEWEKE